MSFPNLILQCSVSNTVVLQKVSQQGDFVMDGSATPLSLALVDKMQSNKQSLSGKLKLSVTETISGHLQQEVSTPHQKKEFTGVADKLEGSQCSQ